MKKEEEGIVESICDTGIEKVKVINVVMLSYGEIVINKKR